MLGDMKPHPIGSGSNCQSIIVTEGPVSQEMATAYAVPRVFRESSAHGRGCYEHGDRVNL